MDSIPDDPDTLARMQGRHVISSRDFDAPLLRQLMRLAARYELGELKGTHPMRCKVLSNLFLDRSHCTGRLSFNAAWLRLGGSLLDFESTVEQIMSRRYAPAEIAERCNSFADAAVFRTGDSETFREILPRLRVPVINAGDGIGEHPTHAMADLYALAKWRPALLQEDPPADQRLTIALFKPEAMVLSPEMQNEEAAHLLNDSPHNGYFAQARGAVYVRMAVFASIAGE